MKNKASIVLKQIISLLSSLGSKAKSRTNAAKARLIMFSLMKNKKVLMESLSHKIHNLLGNNNHNKDGDDDDVMEEDLNKAIVLYNANAKANEEEGGESFKLEDEIDHVADLFITRFHKQIRMQKLHSFKRHVIVACFWFHACLPVFHLEKFPLQSKPH
ncbi:hypothetical protein G4B88_027381 [Cannabis sativa]|uniref:Uncharacterized protein n=1 Tax=Cannabis sativa TaxID=3483 RepID=A0A7J6HRX5_CANSA|nr:hypothetical protein G4B88_027381 [Cannabis sativa]